MFIRQIRKLITKIIQKNYLTKLKITGSYGYTDSYGIYRQVDYVADKNGFRATIKTNEPGTANQS